MCLMRNKYYWAWLENAGLIYDPIKPSVIKEPGSYPWRKAAGIGLLGVSMLDGPAPIMDVVAFIGVDLLFD